MYPALTEHGYVWFLAGLAEADGPVGMAQFEAARINVKILVQKEGTLEKIEIEHRVRDVIDELSILEDTQGLCDSASLYDEGMTSHASVRLMLALEDRFDLEFPDEMLQRECFASIRAISNAVHAVLTQTART